jgi:hypothetical protein
MTCYYNGHAAFKEMPPKDDERQLPYRHNMICIGDCVLNTASPDH